MPNDTEILALYFTPDAIRQHFADDEDEIATAVEKATDAQLREIGYYCISADTLYAEFHRLLVEGTIEVLGVVEP